MDVQQFESSSRLHYYVPRIRLRDGRWEAIRNGGSMIHYAWACAWVDAMNGVEP